MLVKLIVLLLFAASPATGQTGEQRGGSEANTQSRQSARFRVRRAGEYRSLINKLRARGATVEYTREKVSQPFFSVAGRIISVNGEHIQVFEYAQASAADDDAKRVSADGRSIGTNKPSWMATPHFYKSSRLIVLYLGANQTTLEVLNSVLGGQFAGG